MMQHTLSFWTLAMTMIAGVVGFLSSAVLFSYERRKPLKPNEIRFNYFPLGWAMVFFAGCTLHLLQLALGDQAVIPIYPTFDSERLLLPPLSMWIIVCGAGILLQRLIVVWMHERRQQRAQEAQNVWGMGPAFQPREHDAVAPVRHAHR